VDEIQTLHSKEKEKLERKISSMEDEINRLLRNKADLEMVHLQQENEIKSLKAECK